MPRMIHHDRMVNLFIRAMNGGAVRKSQFRLAWAIHGDCADPYWSEVVGRPRDLTSDPARPGKWHTFSGGRGTLVVELTTRCRRCDQCRKARSNEWRWRVREELRRAPRSWFGTLTMGPAEQYRMLSAARHLAATKAVPWNALSDEEKFRRVALTSLKEVTKYIKRVRKQAQVPLRYICVTEKHKSGLPHFHMLVHEVELKPVTHKILSEQWTLGFEKWRLVPIEDLSHARYVTKYISKEAATRIRASLHYGQSTSPVGGVLKSLRQCDL